MNLKIETVEDFIEWFYKEKPRCVMCNRELPPSFSMYLHDGGLSLGNMKMWVYITCANPKCNYQNSFRKLLSRYKTDR
jgi:hypothetical protein